MTIKTPLMFTAMVLLMHVCSTCNAQVNKKQGVPLQPAIPTQPATPSKPASADARAEDSAAIRKVMESFAKAFEARDAKALSEHFTSDGEFENSRGVKLQGRSDMEKAFSGVFAKTPEITAKVEPESLRFLSKDAAIDEGLVTVQRGPTENATKARFSALMVREDGAWRLAKLSESPVADNPSVEELSWLIGQWKSVGGDGVEISTSYMWDPGKKFIHMKFSRKDADLNLSGIQIIGVDPETGMLHSWTFESNGGIGEADWIRDGDHWVLDAEGTLANGSSLVETNVLRHVNDDTLTWQSTDRLLNDQPLADLPPVKVTRVKGEK